MTNQNSNNKELTWFNNLKQKAEDIEREKQTAIQSIRANFVDRVIIFMDVVGSTAFKVKHKDNPEVWILRVQQFSELLASAVNSSNGKVIKFIGDEVMATFENVYDAQNLVGRIEEIEKTLQSVTGFETRIKVAADFGKVYELNFDGHNAPPDPQGSVVDRCARISKFGVPGQVLASSAFKSVTSQLNWIKVGDTELKGLGNEEIFQLGQKTADISPRVEILKEDFDSLTKEKDELITKVTSLQAHNQQLQEQIKKVGEHPIPNLTITDEQTADTWEQFELAVKELSKLIKDAPVSSNTYARFLFLNKIGKLEEYNPYEGRAFNDIIEADLVSNVEGKYYTLNSKKKRNIIVLKALDKIEEALDRHLAHNSPDQNDPFDWSLSELEFWKTYIGYNVIR